MGNEEFNTKLKEQIIDYLNLIDFTPEMINDDDPLFGDALGLDSIDSLELIILLEREYGIKINSTQEGRKILVSVNSMANFIKENQKK